MRLEEQYRIISILKENVNKKLQQELNFVRIKELILWMVKSVEFQRVYKKDNELKTLKFFTDIWISEKKDINAFEMQGDIFYGVHTLADVKHKLQVAKFMLFRLENNVPYEMCEDIIDEFMACRFSPYALNRINMEATEKPLSNLLKLVEVYKLNHDLIRAIGLLQCAEKSYEDKMQIYLNLAECWLTVQEYTKAYECLCNIENPEEEIQIMIKELEKLV